MKKRIISATLVLSAVLSLCACSNDTAATPPEDPPESGSSFIDLLPEEDVGCGGMLNDPVPGTMPGLTALSPCGMIDTLATDVREYLAQADTLYQGATLSSLLGTKSPKVLDQSLYNSMTPTVFTWQWKKTEGDPEITDVHIQLSLTHDFEKFRTIPCKSYDPETETQSVEVLNLMTGTEYYWRVAATDGDGTTVYGDALTFTTMAGPRLISVDGVSNVRDIGGWMTSSGEPISQGRVYRSGRLEEATAAGVETLMNELGIRCEIDLRSPSSKTEKEKAITILDTSLVNYVTMPDGCRQYGEFIRIPTGIKYYLRAFTKAENYPIIIHCRGGADRTGTIVFLLGALCGVSEADLVKEYELTYNRFVEGYQESISKFYDFPSLLQEFDKLPGETLQEKARAYCVKAGLSQEEIDAIVTLMMTPA